MEDNYREVKKAEPCLKLIHMDQVEVEEIEWLFYPFIPYGKVTIIQGDPGEGKTTVVLQIIAKLTKGEAILSETSEGKSEEAGVFLCLSNEGKQIFVMGHPEYDRITLDKEYHRDLEKGLPIDLPYNYYPNDDATKRPLLQWRANSNNLFSNWLNYYVYQVTPYEL